MFPFVRKWSIPPGAGWHTGVMHITKRAAVVAGATVLVIGGAVGVGVASSGSPGEETPETTTSTDATTTTKPPVVTEPTLAPGFEDYTPGGELPAPPVTAAPITEGQTVPTVQGPHGPIYPDGYTEDTGPPPTAPSVPPAPDGLSPGTILPNG